MSLALREMSSALEILSGKMRRDYPTTHHRRVKCITQNKQPQLQATEKK